MNMEAKNNELTNKGIFLSIVIPVRNEEKYIAQTLSQLMMQDYSSKYYEIIVVDGCSNDRTTDIVKYFSKQNANLNITLLHNEKKLSSAARNIGVKQAKGEYIVFLDGHVYIDNTSLLSQITELAIQKQAVVLGRPQPLTPPDISSMELAIGLARSSRLAHSQESYIYSDSNCWVSPISVGTIYHNTLFERIGYFDERFDAAEDLEFNYRLEKLGINCYFSNKLKVNYYPRSSFSALFKQMVRYGLGRFRFISKHPERFTIETITPAFFLLTLLVSSMLGMFHPVFFKIMLAIASLYLITLSFEGIKINRKHNTRFYFLIPMIICHVHIGLGIGFIKGWWEKCIA